MNPTLAKLKGKSNVKFVTKDSKLGELEWVIRPVPFTLLLDNFDRFSDIPESAKKGNLSKEEAVDMQSKIYPMMKAIVPKCIVEPRITEDEQAAADNEDLLHIDDIPFQSIMEIFNEIVRITGLDQASDENRKKLQNLNSDSQ
jgi:hypothetical protein